MASFEQRAVASADGTEIAYRQYGTGPGVVLVHGSMQAAHNFGKLADALRTAGLAVHLVQRRGRGRSGPFGPDYDADKARQDLAAVVADTGARWMFALSAGATIALHLAVKEPAIEKLAVYEPPLSVFRPMAGPWFPQYEREVDEGRLHAAMATLLKSDLGIETRMKVLPRFLLERLFRVAIAEDAKKAVEDRVPLGELIPTFRYDADVVEQISAYTADLAQVRAEVLLLTGTRSPTYLHDITGHLAGLLPKARRVDLRGVGHLAADDDGRPSVVAAELIGFFS